MIVTEKNYREWTLLLIITTALAVNGVGSIAQDQSDNQQQQQADTREQDTPAKETNENTPDKNKENDKENDTDKSATTDKGEKSTEPATTKKPGKKPLIPLFFKPGVKPELTLQKGPGVGKPLSVLPRPFVPVGSLKIPAPKQTVSQQQNNSDDPNQQSDLPSDLNELQNPDKKEGEELNPYMEVLDLDKQQDQQPPLTDRTQQDSLMIEDQLKNLDPVGVGLLPESAENIPPAFWSGLSREDIIEMLKVYNKNGGSLTLQDVSSMMVRSPFHLTVEPAVTAIAANQNFFLSERLSLLEADGDVEAMARLLSNLPADKDWSAFDGFLTRVALAQDQRAEACRLAKTKLATARDPYWLRLFTFCSAVNGNRSDVDFQVSILDEMGALDPSFFELIDHILIEAETGAQVAFVPEISRPINVTLLDATMVTITRATVSGLDITRIDPLAVPMVLAAPGVTDQAKITLIEAALSLGYITPEELINFLVRFTPDTEQTEVADLYLETMKIYWQNQIEKPATPDFTTRLILMKYAMDKEAETPNVDAMRAIWLLGLENDQENLHLLDVYHAILKRFPVSAATVDLAPYALRAALVSGDMAQAKSWVEHLHTYETGTNPQVDEILVNSYPLISLISDSENTENSENDTADSATERSQPLSENDSIIVSGGGSTDSQDQSPYTGSETISDAGADNGADNGADASSDAIPADESNKTTDSLTSQNTRLWWALNSNSERAYDKATLFATVHESMGLNIPEAFWTTLSDGPVTLNARSVSPAQWRQFLKYAAEGDGRAILTQAVKIVGTAGVGSLPPALAGSLVGELKQAGFDRIAHQLAFEILILGGV